MNRTDVLALLLLVLLASPAAAKDNLNSLDEVDDGHTESLDSVDDGRAAGLDSVDEGRTEALNSVDDTHTEALDSADTGRTESLDGVDTGHTYGLDASESGIVPDRLAPVPQAEFDGSLADVWESQLRLAYREVEREGRRYQDADRAYAAMRRTHYPTGDARVEIEHEYAAARSALEDANARYTALVKRVRQAAP